MRRRVDRVALDEEPVRLAVGVNLQVRLRRQENVLLQRRKNIVSELVLQRNTNTIDAL